MTDASVPPFDLRHHVALVTGANSGLGLSVAYGIIRRHEGELTVESVPGEGTTFLIRLPRSSGFARSPAATPPDALPQPPALRFGINGLTSPYT